MTIGQYIRLCLVNNYFTFKGRAPRKEYWSFYLFWVVALFVLRTVSESLAPDALLRIPVFFAALALIPPHLAVSVRRLHDLDKSGWWVLLFAVPIVGFLAWIIWFLSRGTSGQNRYGRDPLFSYSRKGNSYSLPF